MSKVTLGNLTNLQNENTATTTINANNSALTTAIENTLSRDGTSPNSMSASLDMNSNRILNLPEPTSGGEPLRVSDAALLNGGGSLSVSPLPPGGTAGQVLTKDTSTDYDVSWNTPSAVSDTFGVNVVDFGADDTGATDSSAAFQAAIDSLPNGGTVIVPASGQFKISNVVNINHPITITGSAKRDQINSGSGTVVNITAGNASNDVFHIKSGGVLIKDLTISRPGSPVTGRGIVVNDTARNVTDAAVTLGSNIINSASAGFTANDVGAYFYCQDAGIIGATITQVNSSTQCVVTQTAGSTLTGIRAQWAKTVFRVVVQDVYLLNHGAGIHVACCQESVFRGIHSFSTIGMLINNRLWGDAAGDNAVSDCTFKSSGFTTGYYALMLVSGGGYRFSNCKFLFGERGVFIYWDAFSSTVGPWFCNCSIEGGSITGLWIYPNSYSLSSITWTGGEIGAQDPLATQVLIDNAAPNSVIYFTLCGASIRAAAPNTGLISIGKCNGFTISGCTLETGGGGSETGIDLKSNSSNGVISSCYNPCTNKVVDSGTNNSIWDENWLSYSPSLSSGTGSFTSAAASGRYKRMGRTILLEADVIITTNGTAATSVILGLPIAVKSGSSGLFHGRETSSGGKALQGYAASAASVMSIYNYDNTYPGASGTALRITGAYEI